MKDLQRVWPLFIQGGVSGGPLHVLGVDLGTTNSTISRIHCPPKGPIVAEPIDVEQKLPEGTYSRALVPSVVALHQGELLVGEGAKRLSSRASELSLKQNKDFFYDCKNEMGVKKTYHLAPEGYRCAAEIGGKVLRFLLDAASSDRADIPRRVVVTVPASFRAPQRHDTIKAATLAGLELGGGDLLDEPVAAFLHYLVVHGENIFHDLASEKNVLVFDFGGGTCDVAIFRARRNVHSGQLEVASLAVSRYHRLGGGDIDSAIVHEVLIPDLCSQHHRPLSSLGYKEKRSLEPTLRHIAEQLKQLLCVQISDQLKLKRPEAMKEAHAQLQGQYPCKVGSDILPFRSPKLSSSQFNEILKPFLDTELLYARETEYRTTCSIFAPLSGALELADLTKERIDYCLMVGGSSLIPQVAAAIGKFFGSATLLTYRDEDSTKICVSGGAAYHALALELTGKGLIQPICNDTISIRTSSGLVELIKRGVPLPYPAGQVGQNTSLAVPRVEEQDKVELRVELVAGDEERKIFSAVWDIPGPLAGGQPMILEYRIDENQVLEFCAKIGEQYFDVRLENPLTSVVDSSPKRVRIEEIEEDLRKNPDARKRDVLVELAGLYADIGQTEKAIDFFKNAMKNKPDEYILNRLGILYGRLGDTDQQERCYREAARLDRSGAALFNLALALKARGKYEEASSTVGDALKQNRCGPYLTLAALLARSQKEPRRASTYLEEALALFDVAENLDDWELSWLGSAADVAGDASRSEEVKSERTRRQKAGPLGDEPKGLLPVLAGTLVKR